MLHNFGFVFAVRLVVLQVLVTSASVGLVCNRAETVIILEQNDAENQEITLI